MAPLALQLVQHWKMGTQMEGQVIDLLGATGQSTPLECLNNWVGLTHEIKSVIYFLQYVCIRIFKKIFLTLK